MIRFAFPAGRSADTTELLVCCAWNLAAGAVCVAATVFTDFIMPRRSASAVTSRRSVSSSASSRRFKDSERFFGSVTLGVPRDHYRASGSAKIDLMGAFNAIALMSTNP